MKVNIFLLVILTIIVISNSKSFNFEDYNYNDFLINPYRVLGIPPWSSMKIIKSKYRELVKKYHPDKSKGKTKHQFELIQTAYEKIKKEKDDNKNEKGEEEEISFIIILKKSIKDIIIVEVIFTIIYYIAYWTYSLQKLLIKPLTYIILCWVIVINFFPHFFNNSNEEFLTGISAGLIIFVLVKIFTWCNGKKKNE